MTTLTPAPPAPAAADPARVRAKLVDLGGVALLLGIGESTAEKWNAAGRLPAPLRFGRTLRWDLGELEAWLVDARKRGGRPLGRKEWGPTYEALARAGKT